MVRADAVALEVGVAEQENKVVVGVDARHLARDIRQSACLISATRQSALITQLASTLATWPASRDARLLWAYIPVASQL